MTSQQLIIKHPFWLFLTDQYATESVTSQTQTRKVLSSFLKSELCAVLSVPEKWVAQSCWEISKEARSRECEVELAIIGWLTPSPNPRAMKRWMSLWDYDQNISQTLQEDLRWFCRLVKKKRKGCNTGNVSGMLISYQISSKLASKYYHNRILEKITEIIHV